MVASNFERAMPLVLRHEGGFVNHPKDPGGATNLGVTIGTARRLGIDVDGDGDTDIIDIKLLKPKDAAKVYRAEYWNKVKGDQLPSGVDYAVFDFAVNSGPGSGRQLPVQSPPRLPEAPEDLADIRQGLGKPCCWRPQGSAGDGWFPLRSQSSPDC
jgi:hypothetical protein